MTNSTFYLAQKTRRAQTMCLQVPLWTWKMFSNQKPTYEVNGVKYKLVGRKLWQDQVGFHDQRGKARNKPTLSKREANATPPEFAAYLVALARTCGHNADLSHGAAGGSQQHNAPTSAPLARRNG
jgi:hypothetical protein